MNPPIRWLGNGRQVAARLEAALADPDPRTRRAAVIVAGEQGLRTFAGALAVRARVEREESVRRALLEVVLCNRWEPSDSADLVDLRLWAHATVRRLREAAVAPAPRVAVAAAGGALPTRVAPPTVAPPTVALPTVAPSSSRSRSYAAAAAAVAVLDRPATSAGSPSTAERPERGPVSGLTTAIVTGAGGAAGVAVIRALVAAGHCVVGADADSLAVGVRLAHGAAAIPRADDPGFVTALCRAAALADATVVISTVAEEMVALAAARAQLAASGLASWVPHPEAVGACLDKWRFAQVMVGAGILVPATNVGSTAGVPGPWVIKPRRGRGSRDVYVAHTERDAEWALGQVPGAIVQTRLEGSEFTVDALVDRDGRLAGAVPRWRLETKAGISTKGRTFVDLQLVDLVAHVLDAVRLRGPANVQGFMTPDGTPSIVEVNPRFSGGLSLSQAAGADLVGEYLRGVLGYEIRREELLYRPGVTMLRYLTEVFE